MVECFDVVEDLIDWDDKTRKKSSDLDHDKRSDRRRAQRTLPSPEGERVHYVE